MLRVKSGAGADCENLHSPLSGSGGDWIQRTTTSIRTEREGIEMANARVDRMIREMHTEPSFQFFLGFFNLRPALVRVPAEPAIPVSLLKHSAA